MSNNPILFVGEHICSPFAKIHFALYDKTIERIRGFQEQHPDVTVEEASDWINSAILKTLEEYERHATESC